MNFWGFVSQLDSLDLRSDISYQSLTRQIMYLLCSVIMLCKHTFWWNETTFVCVCVGVCVCVWVCVCSCFSLQDVQGGFIALSHRVYWAAMKARGRVSPAIKATKPVLSHTRMCVHMQAHTHTHTQTKTHTNANSQLPSFTHRTCVGCHVSMTVASVTVSH